MWLSAIATAWVCLADGSFAGEAGENKALKVIAVKNELDFGDQTSRPAGPDYYINGGESDGIKMSMLLDVYRPVQVHDRFNAKDYSIKILIGQIKVLGVFPELSIARLQALEPSAASPLVTYRSVMIGDHLVPRPKSASPPVSLSLPSSILFDFDSWQLKPDAYKALSNLSGILTQRKDQDLVIEGHTCDIGSDQYNDTLSLKRATSVSEFLIAAGVIQEDRVRVVGYGERFPVAPNDNEIGRKKNRRVDFRFIPRGKPVPPPDPSSKG